MPHIDVIFVVVDFPLVLDPLVLEAPRPAAHISIRNINADADNIRAGTILDLSKVFHINL